MTYPAATGGGRRRLAVLAMALSLSSSSATAGAGVATATGTVGAGAVAVAVPVPVPPPRPTAFAPTPSSSSSSSAHRGGGLGGRRGVVRRPSSTKSFPPRLSAAASASGGGGDGRDDDDDGVERQLAKARELLARARAKLGEPDLNPTVEIALTSGNDGTISEKKEAVPEEEEEEEEEEDDGPLPFFALDPTASDRRKETLAKSKDENTGLMTYDGDKMAELSEGESWEVRPLSEVFPEKEAIKDEDAARREAAYDAASRQLANRDVAASIFNLRKQLRTEDFEKIFDKRNRFIGEE